MTLTDERVVLTDDIDRLVGLPGVLPARRPWTRRLRILLVGLDAIGLFTAWVIALQLRSFGVAGVKAFAVAAMLTVIGVGIMNALDLYLARAASVRAIELSRVFKGTLLTGAAAIVTMRVLRLQFYVTEVAAGVVLSFGFLFVARSWYRAWLGHRRRIGRNVRDVVVVGAGADAAELVQLLEEHPEMGFRVVGVLGRRSDALEHGLSSLWRGTAEEAPEVVVEANVTGAIITAGTVEPRLVDVLMRDLHAVGAHVHLSTGVRGIDHRRLRAVPMAYEPLLYLEPVTLSKLQIATKRVFDVVVASVSLLLLSPLLLLIAFLIRRHDKGPALFAQLRVGQGGRPFRVLKFRTMVVNAEDELAGIRHGNERVGPLFKMENDPRVTRLGRFLRHSSIDELPQLINVLRGEMSLVGPRPALPEEVATFDDRLLQRNRVRPGITGLWQVEARDNPSFRAYRRLDLFYVDNWSLVLDMIIVVGTVEQLIARMLKLVMSRTDEVIAAEPDSGSSAEPDLSTAS
jgi:exopolysaccharide biosynthesis polyprenyl glycosylphosphotransferase